jgi:hypothetical protein
LLRSISMNVMSSSSSSSTTATSSRMTRCHWSRRRKTKVQEIRPIDYSSSWVFIAAHFASALFVGRTSLAFGQTPKKYVKLWSILGDS